VPSNASQHLGGIPDFSFRGKRLRSISAPLTTPNFWRSYIFVTSGSTGVYRDEAQAIGCEVVHQSGVFNFRDDSWPGVNRFGPLSQQSSQRHLHCGQDGRKAQRFSLFFRIDTLELMVDIDALKRRFESFLPTVDERMRRLIAAAESLAIDYWGISIVSRATGVSRRAIARGIVELGDPEMLSGGAIRKSGGGRKRTVEQDATLVRDSERLIEPLSRGDRSLRCAGLARACANWPRNWALVVTASATVWWPSCCTSWAIACGQTPRLWKALRIRIAMLSLSISTARCGAS
jgi:hypothetical protein